MEQQRFIRKDPNVFDTRRRRRQRHARRTLLFVLIFVAVSLIFVGVCFAVFLRVESIEVYGNARYSYDEIVSRIPVEMGQNIVFFDAASAEESIKRSLPYVGEITIKRDLPSTVVVEIEEEVPYFTAALAGENYILSSDLKVLEKSGTADPYPGMTALKLGNVKRCIVGEKIEFVDPRVADSVAELYGYFSENNIEKHVTSLDIRSRFDIYFNYSDRFEVYLGDMQNADIKVRFLGGIIAELYPDSKGTIDVSDHTEASVLLY